MLESAGLGGEFIQIFARTGNHARIEERRNRWRYLEKFYYFEWSFIQILRVQIRDEKRRKREKIWKKPRD